MLAEPYEIAFNRIREINPLNQKSTTNDIEPAPDIPTMSTTVRVVKLAAVILPFLGFVVLVVSLWNRGFNAIDLALLLGMYVATGLGITVGFHRLFTHRAFETNRAVEVALGILGSMAVQSNLLVWVALHRRHHQHSDTPEDPHSPHHHGEGVAGLLSGLWHAHLGWIFQPNPPGLAHYVKDLRRSRSLRIVSALFPLWVVLGLLIPAAVGGLAMGTWMGAFHGLVWGGLARIFLVHHVTRGGTTTITPAPVRPDTAGGGGNLTWVIG